MIVSECTVAKKNLVYHLLPFDRQFECHSQIVVVERRGIDSHGKCVVQRTGFLEYRDARVAPHQRHCLWIDSIDYINFTAHQCILPGSYINQ